MAIIRKHIDQIFGQKFSLLDQKMLKKYFEDNDLSEEAKLVMKEQWEQFVADPDIHSDLDPVFYKLYYAIDSRKDLGSAARQGVYLNIFRIAASFMIGILITTGILFFGKLRPNTSDQQIEFVSQTGFRNQFRLPDGTTGWLGYGSKLKYTLDDQDQRIVDLNGLAFFDVAHRKKQPFIVKTPAKLSIQVLGTRFNVSAYAEDKTCEVVLEQGRVRLNLQERSVGNLLPNERAIYYSESHTIEKSMVNIADYMAWKDGKLVLNDVTLEEACLKLSRFYNIDFELYARNMDQQKVRLVLENESLTDALNLLTLIAPVKYQVEDRKMLSSNRYSKKKVIIKNQ